MPGNNIQSNTMRNMSASAFNLNQNFGSNGNANAYPGNNFQQPPNPWGFTTMNQVSLDIKRCKMYVNFYVLQQAQSMAQLNMMQQNPWHHSQPWSNFNGSNMSLNLPQQHFMPNEWNPWMQQQQYPYPFPMPNGMCIFCNLKK